MANHTENKTQTTTTNYREASIPTTAVESGNSGRFFGKLLIKILNDLSFNPGLPLPEHFLSQKHSDAYRQINKRKLVKARRLFKMSVNRDELKSQHIQMGSFERKLSWCSLQAEGSKRQTGTCRTVQSCPGRNKAQAQGELQRTRATSTVFSAKWGGNGRVGGAFPHSNTSFCGFSTLVIKILKYLLKSVLMFTAVSKQYQNKNNTKNPPPPVLS